MTSRREFLAKSSKTSLTLSLAGMGIFSNSASAFYTNSGKVSGSFIQAPLPYGFAALEPMIDAKTMEIHYTKHAAAYSSNLLSAAEEEQVDISLPLENVLKNISSFSTKMRNNGGGHYNHELFWSILSPAKNEIPEGNLAKAISMSFENFDRFKIIFENAAKTRFGSGWAWLVLTPNQKLIVCSTPNQDNPLMDLSEIKGIPILGLDVWEHAYYLQYQNRRADYVSAFWEIVNWKKVAERLETAQTII